MRLAIFKFYSAQKYLPSEGDWFHQVEKDLVDIKLELNEEEISLMSHYQFKNLVRRKISNVVFGNSEKAKIYEIKYQEI